MLSIENLQKLIQFHLMKNLIYKTFMLILKEQEIKNILLMAEIIFRNLDLNDIKWGKYLLPFDISKN